VAGKLKGRFSEEAIHLLGNLLKVMPGQRYKAGDILKHPWVSRQFDDPVPMSPLMRQARDLSLFKKLGMVSY